MAVHQRKFGTQRSVYNLRVYATLVLLGHATECVIGKTDTVYRHRSTCRVPRIGVGGIVDGVSIGVVSGHRAAHLGYAVGQIGVRGLERDRPALADVAKRACAIGAITETLRPG